MLQLFFVLATHKYFGGDSGIEWEDETVLYLKNIPTGAEFKLQPITQKRGGESERFYTTLLLSPTAVPITVPLDAEHIIDSREQIGEFTLVKYKNVYNKIYWYYEIEGNKNPFDKRHMNVLEHIYKSLSPREYAYVSYREKYRIMVDNVPENGSEEMRPAKLLDSLNLLILMDAIKNYDNNFLDGIKIHDPFVKRPINRLTKYEFMEPEFNFTSKNKDLKEINKLIREGTVIGISHEIGPSTILLITNGIKTYVLTLKFNRYMFYNDKIPSTRVGTELHSKYIPYSIIEFEEYVDSYNSIFKNTLKVESLLSDTSTNEINKETGVSKAEELLRGLVNFHHENNGENINIFELSKISVSRLSRIGMSESSKMGRNETYDKADMAVASTKAYIGNHLVAIEAKSKGASVIDKTRGTLVGRYISVARYELVKYNIWFMPKSFYEGAKLEKENMIYNYSDDEIDELLIIMDNIKKSHTNDPLIYTTIPTSRGHNTLHIKIETSKNHWVDAASIALRISGSKYRIHFYEAMEQFLKIDKQFYNKNRFMWFEPEALQSMGDKRISIVPAMKVQKTKLPKLPTYRV